MLRLSKVRAWTEQTDTDRRDWRHYYAAFPGGNGTIFVFRAGRLRTRIEGKTIRQRFMRLVTSTKLMSDRRVALLSHSRSWSSYRQIKQNSSTPPSSRHRKVYTIRDRALVGANLNSASTRTSKLSVSRQANALELMLPLTRSLQLPAASVQSKNKLTSGVRSIFTNSVVGCGRKLFTEIGDTSLKWTVKCISEAALDYSVCRPVCVCAEVWSRVTSVLAVLLTTGTAASQWRCCVCTSVQCYVSLSVFCSICYCLTCWVIIQWVHEHLQQGTIVQNTKLIVMRDSILTVLCKDTYWLFVITCTFIIFLILLRLRFVSHSQKTTTIMMMTIVILEVLLIAVDTESTLYNSLFTPPTRTSQDCIVLSVWAVWTQLATRQDSFVLSRPSFDEFCLVSALVFNAQLLSLKCIED